MASTTSKGPRILVADDDGVHGDQLYAECAFGELHISAAGETFTMAGSPAILAVGTTDAGGSNVVASVTAVGCTVDAAAGSITVDKAGVYRLYFNGVVQGEDNEDITLEFYKNGAVFDPDVQRVVEIAAASGLALAQDISKEQLVSLEADDVVTLEVLGSASEVITLEDFSWGLNLVKSDTFEGPV